MAATCLQVDRVARKQDKPPGGRRAQGRNGNKCATPSDSDTVTTCLRPTSRLLVSCRGAACTNRDVLHRAEATWSWKEHLHHGHFMIMPRCCMAAIAFALIMISLSRIPFFLLFCVGGLQLAIVSVT